MISAPSPSASPAQANPIQANPIQTNLMLLFQVGRQQYAIASHQIQEILPYVQLYPVEGHGSIAGLMNYHGTMTPVVDLNRLMQCPDSRPHFGTRIILLKAKAGKVPMGLLAERVLDTLQLNLENLAAVPPELDQAAYLGPIILQDQAVIRIFQPEGLLEVMQG
jgi:chemotaxis-related protein WspB